jgi:hypothetical protein
LYVFLNNFCLFFILDGVFLVNHPQGLRAAAGGDFLPSPPP